MCQLEWGQRESGGSDLQRGVKGMKKRRPMSTNDGAIWTANGTRNEASDSMNLVPYVMKNITFGEQRCQRNKDVSARTRYLKRAALSTHDNADDDSDLLGDEKRSSQMRGRDLCNVSCVEKTRCAFVSFGQDHREKTENVITRGRRRQDTDADAANCATDDEHRVRHACRLDGAADDKPGDADGERVLARDAVGDEAGLEGAEQGAELEHGR